MTLDRIQIRRDYAANWTAANPVLQQGEPALETDTKQQKMGDGSTAWVSLPYIVAPTGAPLNSPAFTGTPTAPTPTPGDNTTKLATTAFVTAAGGGGGAVASVN